MGERSHALAQHLLGKASLDDCSLDEVKNLAGRYPYFAPAQFLLLQKLQQQGEEAFRQGAQKAILYYHDPFAFQYFISPERFYTGLPVETPASEPADTPAAQPYTQPEENVVGQAVETLADEERPQAVQQTEPVPEEAKVEQNRETLIGLEEENIAEPVAFATEAASPISLPRPEAALPAEGELTFEPFHTVDYFASQGIRLSQEDAGKDKFGKQLRSFTEWLKTMKRLPPSQLPTDQGSENKVQHLAQDSLHQSEVWTEAMGEVWEKQGNAAKAIEVYHKLSLLNPSKKAYFAAKIEKLKRS